MRDGDIRSTTFQTKTESSAEDITDKQLTDLVPPRSQTGGVGLDGRKGENRQADAIAAELEKILVRWTQNRNERKLRLELLRILLKLECKQ